MTKFNCPSCGAENSFKSAASIYTVCPYCKSSLFRNEEQIMQLGKVSQIAEDNSPLQLRSSGLWKNKSFSVIGRIRLKWDEGFWNEWCLFFNDGTYGWLAEAQGEFILMRETNSGPLSFADLRLRTQVTLDSKTYYVTDIKEAEIFMAEGELPFRSHQGEKRSSVDLVPSAGKYFATLEYDKAYPNSVRAYVGEIITLKQLEMTYLRSFEEWS